MNKVRNVVSRFRNPFGGERIAGVYGAVKQIDLVQLLRDIMWAFALALVVIDTFLIYVAFGGNCDFGAIIAGMVGCAVIVFCAGEFVYLLWHIQTVFRIMALAAMSAATLLVACGFMQYVFPHLNWFQGGLLPAFVGGLAFAAANIFIVLPLLLHKTRTAVNMLHQTMHLVWHYLTCVLGIAATIAMLGFGGYFIYTAAGGFLEGPVHMVLAYATIVACAAGVILYGLHWEKIFSLPVKVNFRSVEALALGLIVLTLVLLDSGIWNSLHMFDPLSAMVSGSDRLVFIGIIVLFDTTILFAAPWWGHTWSNRRSTSNVKHESSNADGFSAPPADLELFTESDEQPDVPVDEQDNDDDERT